MEIVEKIIEHNDCYKDGKLITPRGIMLHSVGCNQPSAQVFYSQFNQPNVKKSVHAFIDGDTGEVWQTLPWCSRAWHSGGKANNTHISIEMCEPESYTGSTALSTTILTYTTAAELCAMLCKQFSLPVASIISHYEGYKMGIASGHMDPDGPGALWQAVPGCKYTMEKFRKLVTLLMEERTLTTAEQWAVDNGLIKGYTDGTYRMDVSLTRGQLATILKRFYDMLHT